jgi:hypothetical protein
MKAIIKVCTAERKFSEDQKAIMKRVALVLIEHNLSVAIIMKVKKVQKFKFKAISI